VFWNTKRTLSFILIGRCKLNFFENPRAAGRRHTSASYMRPAGRGFSHHCVRPCSIVEMKLQLRVNVPFFYNLHLSLCRGQLKCDGTRAETRFRLPAKRTSPFKSAGGFNTGSRGVYISGSNAGYTMFRGSVKSTGYPFHSPVSPSLPPLPRAS